MSQKWRYVSVSQCIWTIVFCIIAAAVLFIPFSLGTAEGTILAFKAMPLIGDGSYVNLTSNAVSGIERIVPNATVLSIATFLFKYSVYAYFGILAITILFALALAICRVNVVRIIFRVFSIIFAIVMIVISLTFFAFFVGNLVFFLSEGLITNISHHFLTSGYIVTFGFMILSFILIFRFFKWFAKPY